MKEQSNLSDEELKELQEAIRKDCPDMDGKSDDEIRKEAKEYIARAHSSLYNIVKENHILYCELFPEKNGTDWDRSNDDILDDVVSGVKEFYNGNPDAPTKFSDKPTVEWFVDAYVKSWTNALGVLKSIKKNLATFEEWKDGTAGQRNLYDAAHRILPLEQYVQEHPTDFIGSGRTGWKQYLYKGVLTFLNEQGVATVDCDEWTDDDESKLKQYLFPTDTAEPILDIQDVINLVGKKEIVAGRRTEIVYPMTKLNDNLTIFDETPGWNGFFSLEIDEEQTPFIGKYVMANGTSPDPFEKIVENILGSIYYNARKHPDFNGKVLIDPATVYRIFRQCPPHTAILDEDVQRTIDAIRNLMGGDVEVDMRGVLSKWDAGEWTFSPVYKGPPVDIHETIAGKPYYDKKTKKKVYKEGPVFILKGPPINSAVGIAMKQWMVIPNELLTIPKKKSTFNSQLTIIQLMAEIEKMKREYRNHGKYEGRRDLAKLYDKFFKNGKFGPQGEDKDRLFRGIIEPALNYWKDKNVIKDWEWDKGNRGVIKNVHIYLYPPKKDDKLKTVEPKLIDKKSRKKTEQSDIFGY